jgi:uncharacterized protein GlcG (DUF336 family)
MRRLTLDLAILIATETHHEAARRSARPMGVVVLDAGGRTLVEFTHEDASLFRGRIARAKATGALGMGASTRMLARRAEGSPAFFGSLSDAVGGDIVLSPGGVLVRNGAGELLGAVGVSGDAPDIDEHCAAAGVRAAGLAAETGLEEQ